MPIFKDRSVLAGMTVKQAMQRIAIRMPLATPIFQCIRQMIKSKADIVLVVNDQREPEGVVSKTDIMGAFYAGLPKETRLGDIMMGPVQICWPDEPIEQVLDIMKQSGIHQIYAGIPHERKVEGILSYIDIVGLLYRYCRQCRKSHRYSKHLEKENLPRLRAKEVMTGQVRVCKKNDTLYQVMDILSIRKLKAIPIVDEADLPLGIISKTDLVLAFTHGISPDSPAGQIMNSPVASCGPDTLLSDVILKMFVTDIQHLFVIAPDSGKIQGVVSLSDAARFRSGTCRACSASRVFD
jgi:CBS domain-containing protein